MVLQLVIFDCLLTKVTSILRHVHEIFLYQKQRAPPLNYSDHITVRERSEVLDVQQNTQ